MIVAGTVFPFPKKAYLLHHLHGLTDIGRAYRRVLFVVPSHQMKIALFPRRRHGRVSSTWQMFLHVQLMPLTSRSGIYLCHRKPQTPWHTGYCGCVGEYRGEPLSHLNMLLVFNIFAPGGCTGSGEGIVPSISLLHGRSIV